MRPALFPARTRGVKEPQIFPTIPATLPVKAIYRRLGHKQGATRVPPAQEALIKHYMAEALKHLALKGTALILPLQERTPAGIVLAGGVRFESRGLARMLSGAQSVLLMAATGGEEIMQAIATDIAGADVMRGVVFDATASEVVDAALDWIMAYVGQTLVRQGLTLTARRFSAGYGDFALENQAAMHALLLLERIGVSITDSGILLPEKSVTAVAGIRGG